MTKIKIGPIEWIWSTVGLKGEDGWLYFAWFWIDSHNATFLGSVGLVSTPIVVIGSPSIASIH